MGSRKDRALSRFYMTCLATLVVALNGAVSRADETATDEATITIRAMTGLVTVVSAGGSRAPRVGDTLVTPATIETGPGSSLQIEQGTTILEIAPESRVTIPAESQSWITRIIHSIGSVFYRIERRDGREFSVETPYLVSVVKGTEFNVLVNDDSATVSLFEGRLEVLAQQSSLFLAPGDVAMFSRGDFEIGVIRGLGSEPLGAVRPDNVMPRGTEIPASANTIPLRADMPDLFANAGFGDQDVSVTNVSASITAPADPVNRSVNGTTNAGGANPNVGPGNNSGNGNNNPGAGNPNAGPGNNAGNGSNNPGAGNPNAGPGNNAGNGNTAPGALNPNAGPGPNPGNPFARPGSRRWGGWDDDDWDDDDDDDDD